MERFSGVVILITNLRDVIDKAFFRRIKFELEFDIPAAPLRRYRSLDLFGFLDNTVQQTLA